MSRQIETVSPSDNITLAPLPPPVANPALKRLRRLRSPQSPVNPAALVPLFYAALLFFAGIVFAHFQYLRPGFLLASLLPLATVSVLAVYKAPRLIWLPIALIWLLLGIWSAETEPEPAPNTAIAGLADGLLRTVEGTVADAGPLHRREPVDAARSDADIDPGIERETGAKQPSDDQVQRVDLQVAAAEVVTDNSDTVLPIPQTGDDRIRLSIDWQETGAKSVECGQRVRVVVRILPPDTFHDPGAWNRATYLESQEVTALASVKANKIDGNEPRLAVTNGFGSSSPACLLNRWRDSASARLQSLPALTRSLPTPLRATPEDAAMLTALLTGDRTFLTRNLRVGFERTGSFHLIVVSGLHLAILAGCVFALAKRLRLARLPATAITIAATLGYALFTGFAIPAQRSFWMIALYLIGRLLYRDRSPLNVIGFAAICLAAVSPRSIFDASLQMTLLSVAAIAGIAIPLLQRTLHDRIKATRDLRQISVDPRFPPHIAQFRVTLRLIGRHLEAAAGSRIAWRLLPFAIRSAMRLGELLFVTLVVELALALPMSIYFHRVTVYALPVNLFILPLLAILVPSAMLLLVTLAIWPALAIVPAAVSLGMLHFSVFLVQRLGSLAMGDLRVPEPALIQNAAAIVLFVLALQLARGSRLQRRLAFPALLMMATAALWPRPVDHPQNALLFEIIDVGQGDSLLIVTPDGKTLLIDGGGLGFIAPTAKVPSSDFDVGEEVVSAALWSRGIRSLDAVALTHAHHDHMGGLPAILRNFHPRELWVGNNPPIAAYRALLQQAADLGVQVRPLHAGEFFQFGQVGFRVLAPDAGYHPGQQPANNDSLVLQARYRQTSILLAGDAEAPEEQTMLTEPDLKSILLKVGHHGSLTSTRPQFLAAVAPQWAVISCGRRNRFGHPRQEILAELQAAHTRTFRTDIAGAVCFFLDGKSVVAQPLCADR